MPEINEYTNSIKDLDLEDKIILMSKNIDLALQAEENAAGNKVTNTEGGCKYKQRNEYIFIFKGFLRAIIKLYILYPLLL